MTLENPFFGISQAKMLLGMIHSADYLETGCGVGDNTAIEKFKDIIEALKAEKSA